MFFNRTEQDADCSCTVCKAIMKMQIAGVFFKEFVSAPFNVGSVCPSSKALTASLINEVPFGENNLIIDLGAGSGIISEELVKAGISPDRILAVEISSGYAEVFNKCCPDVPLVIGDARALLSIIAQRNTTRGVSAIISSLPLRMFPADLVSEIMAEIYNVLLSKGGVFIQYTYAWWMRFSLRQYGFTPRSDCMVLANIPPARVESYTVNPGDDSEIC
jgi:phosphatidylethanolamine/phosphatidyl-N-methylethanolamine N-methyltransferase